MQSFDDFMQQNFDELLYVYYAENFYEKEKKLKTKFLEHYENYKNVFNEKIDEILLFHRKDFDYIIKLKFNLSFIFKFLYNLFDNELKILKKYINKYLTNEFIFRFNLSAETLILFIKKKMNHCVYA